MKRYLLLLVIFVYNNCSIRAQNDNFFTFETSVTGDFIKNMKGGISREFTYIGMEELTLNFDLEKMGLWAGGEVFLHGLNTHGALPSESITGDLQVFSNIESGNYTGLYEFYLKQTFGNISILIGQHDLNVDFVGTEYGGTFINSSFGISPSVSVNVPVSIYPLAAPALIVSYDKQNHYNVKLGLYDGNPGDPETNRYNLQPNIDLDEGMFAIGQFEWYRTVNGKPENFKFGAYYHSSTFQDYTDTLKSIKGNYGGFVVSDIVLLSSFAHPHRYFSLFLQGSVAPKKINKVNYYLGGGVHLNGMLPKRFNDVMGVAFAYANISPDYLHLFPESLKGELALEFTYKFSVFEYYTIQPNLQYIINPGVNAAFSNALVALIRFNISLSN